jgi:hypothetical protein
MRIKKKHELSWNLKFTGYGFRFGRVNLYRLKINLKDRTGEILECYFYQLKLY